MDIVKEFRKNCSETIGNYYGELFDIGMYQKNATESPIEEIFFYAVSAIVEIESLENIKITAQFQIDKYYVDFLVQHGKKKVVVECDSQQFHDTTESQRRYEKQRERFIVSKGYPILRFTGKELLNDPFSCAVDVLGYLTGKERDELMGSIINYGPYPGFGE